MKYIPLNKRAIKFCFIQSNQVRKLLKPELLQKNFNL
jgi:hypothetical protein